MRPLLLALALLLTGLSSSALSAADYKLWLYVPTNLQVDKSVEELDALFRRAKKAGYSTILLADSKFGRLHDVVPRYFQNAARVKQLAAELGLEIVPAVFPIGYSNDILYQDPNLAEALPVKDALFIVSAGVAKLHTELPTALPGGDFSDLKKWSWKDDAVVADNGTAKVADFKENARLNQKVKVQPFRQYHVSVRIKTENFTGTPEIKAIGKHLLNFASLGVKPTQDWTTHHAVFNSLENIEVNLYFGMWGGGKGRLWWDDAKIEEVGLQNLVRRPGAPLVVKKEGGEVLVEGKDFEPVRDPGMGSKPYAGEYTVWHEPPVIRTKLPDGTKLRVSYHHVVTIHDGQTMICPSEPKTMELLKDQAARLQKLWQPKAWMMSHDEIRVLNWCAACQKRNLDAGALLADNAKACTKILRELTPDARIYVWNDMFDPAHNAHDNYYLVRGNLAGSWEGLDKNVTIMNWHSGKAKVNVPWFSERGHKQVLAGFYDAPAERVQVWLDAAKGVPGIEGIMYTTWKRDYRQMEKFAELVKAAK
ncbi:MAG: hypothetical protein ACO1QS_11330 [Verrucomicrobiota bacterium]